MTSRLILRWEIDGKLQRDIRMWIPEGDAGIRLYDLAQKLLGVMVGLNDVEYADLEGTDNE